MPGIPLMEISGLVIPTVAIGVALLLLVMGLAFAVARPGIGSGVQEDGSIIASGTRRSRRRRTRTQRRVRRAVMALAVVAVLLGGFEAARWATSLERLQNGAALMLRAEASAGQVSSPPQAQEGTRAMGADATAQLSRSADFLATDPLARVGRHLPWISDQVVAVQDLTASGLAAGGALNDQLQVQDAYRAAASSPEGPGGRLLNLLRASAPALADADGRLSAVLPQLLRDQHRPLLPPIATQVNRAVDRLRKAQAVASLGAAAAQYAPAALGANGPTRYLVLYANPAELRPAGGYVGAAGTVEFAGGAPSNINIVTQDEFDFPRRGQHVEVPPPLARFFAYTPKDSLQLGEAGWDPDFPSAAKTSEAVYSAATGKSVDGTISLDPYAVSAFLAVTGRVSVTSYGTFDSNNFFQRVNVIVNVDRGPGSGKGALPVIASAIIRQALTAPVSSWPRLLAVFRDQAKGRHLQLSVHDGPLQGAVTRAGFAGAIAGPPDDYVMVVDANVGANKDDYYATKTAQVRAEVSDSGLSRHELVLHYSLPPLGDAVDLALNPGDGAYQDYVRVYLPETSNLVDFRYTQDGHKGEGGLDRTTGEHGKKVLAVFFRLPRGHSADIRILYDVTLNPGSSYDLLVQKQAGIPNRLTTVEVSYPGGHWTGATDLTADQRFGVSW